MQSLNLIDKKFKDNFMAQYADLLIYTDLTIVIGFMLLTLAVGLKYGRDVKSLEDFALGGRNFSTVSLVSTIVATSVTGSLFVVGLSRTYSHGFYDFIPTLGIPLSLMLTAYIFIPKMSKFIGSISVANSMRHYYGTKVQIITAITAIIANVGAVAVQFKVFGNVVSYLINITAYEAIIYSGIVVTVYSAFGGIKAVTFTDVLQLTIFGTVIPFIGFIVWDFTFSVENYTLYNNFTIPQFNLNEILDYQKHEFWEMVLLIAYFTIPSFYPAYFQRIAMGRDVSQAKTAFKISAIILFLVIVFTSWTSFLIYSLDSSLNSEKLLVYIINNFAYTGFKGFMIAGIMAMSMSSADSFINVASVLFTHDVCKPLKIIEKKLLFSAKLFALMLGAFSISLAIMERDLLKMILLANAFYIPMVTPILIITILGFRTTSQTILVGMGSAFLGVIIWKQTTLTLDPIIPMMILNLITTLSYHYITGQEGNWVNTKEEQKQSTRLSLKEKWEKFNLIEFCKKNSAYSETVYMFFGIFCFISTIITIYLTHDHNLSQHKDALFFIYPSMLIISTFFMLFPAWSQRIRHPIVVYVMWNITIFYMLTFCSIFFVLLSKFGHMQMIVFTLNLMVLFNLRKWKTAFFMVVIGLSSGVYGFLAYKGINLDQISDAEGYFGVVYISILLSAAVIALLKPRQEHIEEIEHNLDYTVDKLLQTKQHKSDFLNTLNHEMRIPLNTIVVMAENMAANISNLSQDTILASIKCLEGDSYRLKTLVLNLLETADSEKGVAVYDFKKTDITVTCAEVINNFKNKALITFSNHMGNNFVSHDPMKLKVVLFNIINDGVKYGQDKHKKINIDISKKEDDVIFKITSIGHKLLEGEEEKLFDMFYQGSYAKEMQKGVGLGLHLCKKIIEKHGGKIWTDTTDGNFTVGFSLK